MPSEAPANRVGKLARAILHDQDGEGPSSLRAAAKVHYAHGERDAHRLFEKYWLSLKVPISIMEITITNGEIVSIPHYKAMGAFVKFYVHFKSVYLACPYSPSPGPRYGGVSLGEVS